MHPRGKSSPIRKLLIANRGEIAARIAKTARKLGIPTAAVFTLDDKASSHTSFADEAYLIGSTPTASSYMNAESLIEIATSCGADAIHPGYGYLSESGRFAQLVEESNLKFIGPPSAVVKLMGDKRACNSLLRKLKIPLLPGYCERTQDDRSLHRAASAIGFPLVIKPALGGGGKGITLVRTPEAFPAGLAKAKRESVGCFGDATVILERYVERFRHVESQIACDAHGAVLHLGHRDCSVQRRFQKVIEEAPACLPLGTRRAMERTAVRIARTVRYVGVGTVEFMLDCATGQFYFMEMNTRLQVEHPVTEGVVELDGEPLDVVGLQLGIAGGMSVKGLQGRVKVTGHAIEARVYAENPSGGFVPQTGRVRFVEAPGNLPGVRVDSVIRTGERIVADHDPMVAKVIARGETRVESIQVLRQALEAYALVGVENNLAFLRKCLATSDFRAGAVDSNFVKDHWDELTRPSWDFWKCTALAAMVISTRPHLGGTPLSIYQQLQNFRVNTAFSRDFTYFSPFLQEEMAFSIEKVGNSIDFDGNGPSSVLSYRIRTKSSDSKTFSVSIISCRSSDGCSSDCTSTCYEVIIDQSEKVAFTSFLYTEGEIRKASLLFPNGGVHSLHSTVRPVVKHEHCADSTQETTVRSPISGRIARLCVASGAAVRRGDVVLYLHAMKMEHEVRAKSDGIVKYFVAEGEAVALNSLLASILPGKAA